MYAYGVCACLNVCYVTCMCMCLHVCLCVCLCERDVRACMCVFLIARTCTSYCPRRSVALYAKTCPRQTAFKRKTWTACICTIYRAADPRPKREHLQCWSFLRHANVSHVRLAGVAEADVVVLVRFAYCVYSLHAHPAWGVHKNLHEACGTA